MPRKLPRILREAVIELTEDMWVADGKLIIALPLSLPLEEEQECLRPFLERAVNAAERIVKKERRKVKALKLVKTLLTMLGA